MPDTVLTQNPTPVWDEVITYPVPRREDVLPQANPPLPHGRFSASVGGQIRENSFTREWMGATNNGVAAGYSVDTLPGGGPPYIGIGAAGIGRFILGLDAMTANIDCGNGGAIPLAPGASYASKNRSWTLRWLMRSPLAAFAQRSGLVLMPSNNRSSVRWVDEPVAGLRQGGFGFVGDGAGDWQYASYDRAGALVLRESIVLPAHTATEWNLFELWITNTRVGAPATVEILFNGQLIATRDWQGTLLEPYSATLREYCYLPVICGGSIIAAAGGADFTEMECKKGRFTRLGLELL